MLNTLFLPLLIGLVLGFLAGLGIGGGSLLMLWLTLVMQVQYPTARAVNLLFFLAAAGSVCLYRFKKGHFRFRTIFPAIIGGCIAAAFFSWLGNHIDLGILKKFFGLLLLFTGLRELFYRPRKAK